jgi:hypothetical protein
MAGQHAVDGRRGRAARRDLDPKLQPAPCILGFLLMNMLDWIKSADRILYLLCSISERERYREMGEREINLLLCSRNSSRMPCRWMVARAWVCGGGGASRD